MRNKTYRIYDPLECFDEIYYLKKSEVIDFANDEVKFTDYPNTKFVNINMALKFLHNYGFEILNCKIKTKNELLDEWLEKYNKKLIFKIIKHFKYHN
ncbi:hypothetical protein BUY99_13660 [Staphylococcus gallinarum]|uniref:hypothetical protein n=1 Tax=Staphylococcus TaxID=1279 RepID=UPI000E696D6A|nr:hypothetical protein [Staphylococcus gallinarum]RIL18490.1 hypothetical protein BUY99_13660 [Staphylococcus gallinarum]